MTRRSASGRFLAEQPRDARFLLTIVRDVAAAAVADGPTRTPLSVTHSEFKQAALLPELVERYGRITTPNAICANFPDRQGRPIRWHTLLALAFADERSELSIRRVHEARLKVDEEPDLSDDHVHFALNYVVGAERELTGNPIRILRGSNYDRIRAQLIATDRRRKTPHDLERMLPTRNQIERVAGGWWRACEIAGLALPTAATPAGRMGVPLVEAALRYYVESGGYLPSYGQALDFASR